MDHKPRRVPRIDLGGLLIGVGGTDGYFSGFEYMLPLLPSGSLASHISMLLTRSRLYRPRGSLSVLCDLETSFGRCGLIDDSGIESGLNATNVGRSKESCLLCNDDGEFDAWMTHDQYKSISRYCPHTEQMLHPSRPGKYSM